MIYICSYACVDCDSFCLVLVNLANSVSGLQVYALTGGLAPLIPAIEASQLKKRPPSDEKVFMFIDF